MTKQHMTQQEDTTYTMTAKHGSRLLPFLTSVVLAFTLLFGSYMMAWGGSETVYAADVVNEASRWRFMPAGDKPAVTVAAETAQTIDNGLVAHFPLDGLSAASLILGRMI